MAKQLRKCLPFLQQIFITYLTSQRSMYHKCFPSLIRTTITFFFCLECFLVKSALYLESCDQTNGYVCLGLNHKLLRELLSQGKITLTINALHLSSKIYENCIVDASDLIKYNEKHTEFSSIIPTIYTRFHVILCPLMAIALV